MRVTKNKNGSYNIFGISDAKIGTLRNLVEAYTDEAARVGGASTKPVRINIDILTSQFSMRLMNEFLEVVNIIDDL